MEKLTKNIKILQFGEGNFLRAFVDFFIKKMNDQGVLDSHVCVVQPLSFGRIDNLKNQDGLYTLYLQGIENGEAKKTHEVIDVLSDFINPYTEYDRYLDYAKKEDLELIISNTTEADICIDNYNPVGDSVITVDGFNVPIAPISNVVDFYIAHVLEIKTVEECIKRGITPPCWTSANTPGGDEKNKALLEKYNPRVKML